MSRKQSRRKPVFTSASGRRKNLAAAITLVLMCVIVTSLLAQVDSRKKGNRDSGDVSVMSLSAGSPKEYVYAGSRLVATEESLQGCDTSNNPDTDSDGIPNGVEQFEGTNPCVKDNDIFGSARLFVMQQYRDFLGREGDTGGITFWTNTINQGSATRAQVIDNFFNSSEFQGTVSPVTRLYFAYFLRIPDYAGLMFWVNSYRQGATLNSISEGFAGSVEFQTTYGSLNNTQYVTLLYQNVLGRAPDSGGLSYWVGVLNNGATRGQVMLGFSESQEYRQTSSNKVYVTMMYVGMLRRAPDQGGFDFWVNAMNSGTSGLNLIQGFLTAPEYHNRFLP